MLAIFYESVTRYNTRKVGIKLNQYLKRAYELKDELIAVRRKIHQFGGVGWDIKETSDFVFEKLVSYGLKPKRICETGIVCTIGEGGKVFLCRADMDALPIKEEADIDYACKNGTMHACGHDMHTAMLLVAAKILSENKDNLKGRVKLMFQPAEEIFDGCKTMIEHGVLENPKVDAAMRILIPVIFVMLEGQQVHLAMPCL